MIFGNGIVAIPFAHSAARVGARSVSARKENQMMWIKKNLAIVAMPLPKMGGGKKRWWPKSREELKKKCYIHNIFTTFSQQITSD